MIVLQGSPTTVNKQVEIGYRDRNRQRRGENKDCLLWILHAEDGANGAVHRGAINADRRLQNCAQGGS
jgi:hypothetical protein